MKRILSAIFVIVLLVSSLSFSSCTSTGKHGSGSFTTFKITQDYVIVRPENATFTEINAARAMKQAIEYSTGLSLEIVTDTAVPHDKEIVIGNAKRDGVTSAKVKAGDMGYTIFALDEDIYIYGSSDTFLDIASNIFIKEYVSISTTVTLSKVLSVVYNHTFKKSDLALNGVDISQYKIVYDPKTPTTYYRTKDSGWVESSRYKDAAEAFQQEIYLLTGKTLEVVSSANTELSEYEILVGKVASRDEVKQFYTTYGIGYADEKYGYGLVGSKLLISGGSPNAAYFAGKAFSEYCSSMEGSNFNASLKEGTKKLIKVACIGDGITHGTSSVNVNTHAYPIYLQKLLGFEYYVANYGTPDKKMTDYAVKTEAEKENGTITDYDLSISFVPDVVIIMLGTNDANPTSSKLPLADNEEKYSDAASKLVSAYRKINSNVQIYLATPPSEAKNSQWETNLATIAEWNRAIAGYLNCNVIDVFTDSASLGWDFPDDLHPENEQYADLASVIYNGLKYTIILK